jgi:hypothetical protein
MVKRKVAMGSGTLKNMLDESCKYPFLLATTELTLMKLLAQFMEAIHDTCPIEER